MTGVVLHPHTWVRAILAWMASFGILVAALALAPAPAVAASDPVLAAIDRAQRAGGITPATARSYRTWWRNSARSARTLRSQGRTSRALEIEAVRSLTLRMARRNQLGSGRIDAAMANVRATNWLYRYTDRWPRAYERIMVPFDSVVYAHYPGNGIQFQPLFTFSHANRLHALGHDRRLQETMDRAMELSSRRAGYLTWEYYFDFGGGSPPWNSAMAQATGIQALGRTWERTGDRTYLRHANRAIRGFEVDARRGGVMTPAGRNGRWYLLYPFLPGQRVLNGHLQALLGLEEYARTTGHRRAAELVDLGVAGSRPILRRFDTGAWSNYVPGVEASLDYHDLMTTQLSRLGRRLDDPDFARMARRFGVYRVTAPQVRVPPQRIHPLYPVPNDGWRQRISLRLFVNKRSTLRLTVRNRNGAAVRTQVLRNVPRGRHTFTWDGHNGAGRAVPPGAYTLHMTATDVIGNARQGQLTAALQVRRDTTPPTIDAVRVRGAGSGRQRVVVRARDGESPRLVVTVGKGNRTLARATMRRGQRQASLLLPPGERAAGAIVRVTDTAGNRSQMRL